MERYGSHAGAARFGVFELGPRAEGLRKNGLRISLPVQSLRVLALLIKNPGQVVTREELRQELWPDGTFVDFDHGLNSAVNRLRAALHDSAENPRYIETLARHGYRFIAPVETVAVAESHAAVPPAPPRPASLGILKTSARPMTVTTGALLALLLALLGLKVVGLYNRSLAATGANVAAPQRIQSIAVLPLENLSRDPDQEYFADGMTEALITGLGKVNALRIISRTSVMRYKGTKSPLPEIARQLGVDAIVEGTVLRSGSRVRITANLILAASDRHLWAESYERDLRDVLALQSEVAQDITNQIQVKLTPQQHARMPAVRPIDPEAQDLYLKGRYEWNKRTGLGLTAGIRYFQEAIAKDPNCAAAYAGLADSYHVLVDNGIAPAGDYDRKARAAALKALEIDGSLAEAHTSLAVLLADSDWDWTGAEKEYRRAMELNPGYATAHHFYGLFLSQLGRNEEAIQQMEIARQLDPLSVRINANFGAVLYVARQFDAAVEQLRKTLELEPDDQISHDYLGWVYLQKGMHQEAIAEFQKAVNQRTGSLEALAGLGHAYAVSGQRKEARRVLQELHASPEHRNAVPYWTAAIYAGLGERDAAFAWLDKALQVHDPPLLWVNAEPSVASLRSDPRFHLLVRRMNFPP